MKIKEYYIVEVPIFEDVAKDIPMLECAECHYAVKANDPATAIHRYGFTLDPTLELDSVTVHQKYDGNRIIHQNLKYKDDETAEKMKAEDGGLGDDEDVFLIAVEKGTKMKRKAFNAMIQCEWAVYAKQNRPDRVGNQENEALIALLKGYGQTQKKAQYMC